jgi:hypothetical protein
MMMREVIQTQELRSPIQGEQKHVDDRKWNNCKGWRPRHSSSLVHVAGDGEFLTRRFGRHIVHVIDQRNKQVKEQFATGLHLHLHGSASLEGVARADDECKVMCS